MKLVRCGIEKFPRFDSRYRLVRNFKILNIATVLVSTDKDVQLYNLVFLYDMMFSNQGTEYYDLSCCISFYDILRL